MAKTWNNEQLEALRLLDEATAEYQATEKLLDDKRTQLHEAVARALRADIGPSEVTRHSPYDRQHVGRIREEYGIPPRPRPGQKPAGDNASS